MGLAIVSCVVLTRPELLSLCVGILELEPAETRHCSQLQSRLPAGLINTSWVIGGSGMMCWVA